MVDFAHVFLNQIFVLKVVDNSLGNKFKPLLVLSFQLIGGVSKFANVGVDGTVGAGPALDGLFLLELPECGVDISDVGAPDFKGEVLEGVDFNGGLDGLKLTSALQRVQVIDDLV